MNKIVKKEKVNGTVEKIFSEKQPQTFVFLSEDTFDITLQLLENANVTIFHYGKNTEGKIKIDIQGENACINYHYQTISIKENKVHVEVLHHAPHTESHLFMHGYNKAQQLTFLVDVSIPKGMKGSIATQENQIYNEKDAISTICPNLYIDEYDVSSTHASFTGPFDKNIEFYLGTRGLEKEKIQQLLLEGFLIKEGLSDLEKVSFFQIRKEG